MVKMHTDSNPPKVKIVRILVVADETIMNLLEP